MKSLDQLVRNVQPNDREVALKVHELTRRFLDQLKEVVPLSSYSILGGFVARHDEELNLELMMDTRLLVTDGSKTIGVLDTLTESSFEPDDFYQYTKIDLEMGDEEQIDYEDIHLAAGFMAEAFAYSKEDPEFTRTRSLTQRVLNDVVDTQQFNEGVYYRYYEDGGLKTHLAEYTRKPSNSVAITDAHLDKGRTICWFEFVKVDSLEEDHPDAVMEMLFVDQAKIKLNPIPSFYIQTKTK